jgi:hypothetical protein
VQITFSSALHRLRDGVRAFITRRESEALDVLQQKNAPELQELLDRCTAATTEAKSATHRLQEATEELHILRKKTAKSVRSGANFGRVG